MPQPEAALCHDGGAAPVRRRSPWGRSARGTAFALALAMFVVGAATMRGETRLPVRGLPFTRFYPLEDIGNVPRGSHLNFDRFGRLALVHDGYYTVLNDSVWLDIEDTARGDVIMTNVVQAPDGRAYYGAGGSWGVVETSPQGKLRPRPFVTANPPPWVPVTNFNDIVPTAHGVYFGGFNGIVYWDFAMRESRFFEVPRLSRLFSVGQRIYAAAFGEPLRWIDGPGGRMQSVPGTNFGEMPVDRATPLDADRSLIATRDGHLLVFDGQELTPWEGQIRNRLNGRISCLQRLIDGGVAVAIAGEGLFVISAANEQVMALTSSEYQRIIDMATNEAGVLWVAGEVGLVKVFYGSPLTVFGQRLGMVQSWPTVVRCDGRVLVASSGRLSEAIPGALGAAARFEPVAEQPSEGVWAVAASGKQLLIGNARGAFMRTPDRGFQPVVSGLDVSRLLMIAPDVCLVLGRVQYAAIRWADGRWQECAARIPSLGFAQVAHVTKHAVWLELGGNQVVRVALHDGVLQARQFTEFPWNRRQWINIGVIDDTVIMTGPEGNRVYFNDRTEQFCQAPELDRLLARSPQWVLRAVKDESGTIWATHELGVVSFVPRGDDYVVDSTSFDLNNEHFPFVQVLPHNDVWIATGQSLYHVDRRDTSDLQRALRPKIVAVTNGRTNDEISLDRVTTSSLQLPHSQNDLSFRLFAGSYAWRRAPAYEFRLADGQSWRPLASGSLLNFPGLHEGNYHLEVRIANSGEAVAPKVSVDFEILPPWHRTRAAYLAGLLGLGLLIYGLVRWSVHRAHHRNQALEKLVRERTDQLKSTMAKLNEETRNAATLAERDRLAGEIHDSLQQGLSGLMLQIDATLKLPALTNEVRSRLNVARNMVSFTRHEVQHAVWDLETPLLEDTELGDALRKLSGLIGPGASQIEFAIEGPSVVLPSAMKHHLLRIAQEAITNAVRHASAATVRIRLLYAEQTVTLSIVDNGVGFNPDDVLGSGVGHFGLRGLRGRAAKIGGKLRIESSPGRGATIEIVVPLPPASSSHHDTSGPIV